MDLYQCYFRGVMRRRYSISKRKGAGVNSLLCLTGPVFILFFSQELAQRIEKNTGPIVATVDPGYCDTSLDHAATATAIRRFLKRIVDYFIHSSDTGGSRTIIHAATTQGGKEQHGKYLTNSRVERESDYSLTQEGLALQRRLWVKQFSPDF